MATTNESVISNSVLFNRKQSTKKTNKSYLSKEDKLNINYKNLKLLLSYCSEKGRILPKRISALSSYEQRLVKQQIKIARELALLPFAGA